MQNITGKIAFGGIAIGKIKEISKENNVVRRVKIEDAKAEIARFEAARDQAAEELKGLYDKAVKEVGEANAAIFPSGIFSISGVCILNTRVRMQRM